jgi:hypothetical protein
MEQNVSSKLVDVILDLLVSETVANSIKIVEADADAKKKLKVEFEHNFKKLLHNLITIQGHGIEVDDLFIFEPKTMTQKLDAIYQNTLEIQLVVCLFVLCYFLPSLLAIGFLVLSHNLLLTSTKKSSQRLKYAMWITVFNFIVLVLVVVKKRRMLKFRPLKYQSTEEC